MAKEEVLLRGQEGGAGADDGPKAVVIWIITRIRMIVKMRRPASDLRCKFHLMTVYADGHLSREMVERRQRLERRIGLDG